MTRKLSPRVAATRFLDSIPAAALAADPLKMERPVTVSKVTTRTPAGTDAAWIHSRTPVRGGWPPRWRRAWRICAAGRRK